METPEQRTMAKVLRRLVPFLIACYFVSYLDRVNIGFAALDMNKHLGLSASAFGFGAGIFFITYLIFEVPSNLLLVRFGARRWIARIMLTWGLVSGATAFISGHNSFFVVRALLGVAEAGFFPGITFFLTLWFPAAYRARVMGYFLAAAPLSTVIGAPISGALLSLNGFMGLYGWQWMFILEALPAVVLSGVVLVFLEDYPAKAKWLKLSEREWLTQRIVEEEQTRPDSEQQSIAHVLSDSRVLLGGLVHFGIVLNIFGVSFFLPQIVKSFGMSNLQTGFVSAVPYAVAFAAIIWCGRHSDATLERRFHAAIPITVAGFALAAAALLNDPTAKMVAFSVAAFGSFGALPAFWALCTSRRSGAAAAVSIAVVSGLGNLAGFIGPLLMGRIKDQTGSYAGGLLLLAAVAVAAGGAALLLGRSMPTKGSAVSQTI